VGEEDLARIHRDAENTVKKNRYSSVPSVPLCLCANLFSSFAPPCVVFLLFTLFSGCAGTPKPAPDTATIELYSNGSIGDNWVSSIKPDGIIEEISGELKTQKRPPAPGMGGTLVFTYKAVTEGEAKIIFSNLFRGGDATEVITYRAVVDKNKNVTITEVSREKIQTKGNDEDGKKDYKNAGALK